MILQDFATYLKTVRRYSEATVASYVHDVRLFLENSNGDISSDSVARWVGARCNDAPSSLRRRVSSVRTFSRFCNLSGRVIVPVSPISVELPRQPDTVFPVLDLPSITRCIDVAWQVSTRDGLLFELAYSLGLRVGELVSLRWGDFDFSAGTIRVRGKGNKERVLPLSADLSHRVFRHIQSHSFEDFVFKNRKNRPLSVRNVQYIFKKLFKIAGLRSGKYSTHSLRRTAATHLLDSGATVRDVQAFLGHSRLSTTQRYTKLATSKLMAVVLESHPRQ